MNHRAPFGTRRAQAVAVGCVTVLGLVVALASPLDFGPGPVPVTPVCRLCATAVALNLS